MYHSHTVSDLLHASHVTYGYQNFFLIFLSVDIPDHHSAAVIFYDNIDFVCSWQIKVVNMVFQFFGLIFLITTRYGIQNFFTSIFHKV
ncbi:hypothetical protein MKleb_5417 (plasmid) [Klebsiella sp. PL-2018]|nr:hypothetical protein MKleb_5417 [Klebsiella sp. PL-2018]